jgi:hypothetical protein
MEEREIISLWKAQDAKIEQVLTINKQLLKEAIGQKAQSALRSLTFLLTWGIILFVIYIVILGNILFWAVSNYSSGVSCFILSLSAIFLINIKGLSDYIRHLYMANNVNYEGSVAEIQKSLTLLQLSVIQHARTMFLQVPFFSTLFLSINWMVPSPGLSYIFFQVSLTGIFIYGTYWLYRNLTIANLEKKWLQLLISGSGGKSVMKALAFYKELEEYNHVDL